MELKTHSGADFHCAEAPRGSGKASLPRRPCVRHADTRSAQRAAPSGKAGGTTGDLSRSRCPGAALPASWRLEAVPCVHSSLAVQELQRQVAAPVLPGRPSPAPAQPGPQVRGGRAGPLNGAFVRAGPALAPHLKMLRQQHVLPPGEPATAWPLGCGLRQRGPVRDGAALELGSAGCRGHGPADTRQGPSSSGAQNTSGQVAREGTGRSWGRAPSPSWSARGRERPRGHCGKTVPQAATGSSGTGRRPPGWLLPLPSSPGATTMQDAPPPSHEPLSVLSCKQRGWVRAIRSLPGAAGPHPTPRRGAKALARSRRGCE